MPDNFGERVKALEINMERLMGNGQPGIIADHEARLDIMSKRVDRMLWVAAGAIMAAAFFSGTGTFTLDHILKMLVGR